MLALALLAGCAGKPSGRVAQPSGEAGKPSGQVAKPGAPGVPPGGAREAAEGGRAASPPAAGGAATVRSYLEAVAALSDLLARGEEKPEERGRLEGEMRRLSERMAALAEDPRAAIWPHYGRPRLPAGLRFRVAEVAGPFYRTPEGDMEGYLALLGLDIRGEALQWAQEEMEEEVVPPQMLTPSAPPGKVGGPGTPETPSSLWLAFYLVKRDGAWRISFAHPTGGAAARYARGGNILEGVSLFTRPPLLPSPPGASGGSSARENWEPVARGGRLKGPFKLEIEGLRLPAEGLVELGPTLYPEPGTEGYPDEAGVNMPFENREGPEGPGSGVTVERKGPPPGGPPGTAWARVTLAGNFGDVPPGRYRTYLGLSLGDEGGVLHLPLAPYLVEVAAGGP